MENIIVYVLGTLAALAMASAKPQPVTLEDAKTIYYERTTEELVRKVRVNWSGESAYRALAYIAGIHGEAGDLIQVNYRLVGTSDHIRKAGLQTNMNNGATLAYPDGLLAWVVPATGGYNVGPAHHASFDRSGWHVLVQDCVEQCFVALNLGCYSRGKSRYRAVRRSKRLPRVPTCTVEANGFLEVVNVSRQ